MSESKQAPTPGPTFGTTVDEACATMDRAMDRIDALRKTKHDLIATLESMAAWVAHWREDARCNLKPTSESLMDAAEEIAAALSKSRGEG